MELLSVLLRAYFFKFKVPNMFLVEVPAFLVYFSCFLFQSGMVTSDRPAGGDFELLSGLQSNKMLMGW